MVVSWGCGEPWGLANATRFLHYSHKILMKPPSKGTNHSNACIFSFLPIFADPFSTVWPSRPAHFFVFSSSLLSLCHIRGSRRPRQLQSHEGRLVSGGASSASTCPPRSSGAPGLDAAPLQEGRGAAVQQLQVSRVPNAAVQQGGAGHSLPADQRRSQLSEKRTSC